MATCSDRGDWFKVEVAGFVLSTSSKKDGGRNMPWSSRARRASSEWQVCSARGWSARHEDGRLGGGW